MSAGAPVRTASSLKSFVAALAAPQPKAPRIIGAVTYVVGFLDILLGLQQTVRVRLRGLGSVVPGTLGDAASAATVVTGVLLILLAHGLRRRKRRAWRTAVVLLGVSVVLHALRLHWVIAAASLVTVLVFLMYRRQFYALGDPATRWRSLWTFVGLFTSSTVIGMAALSLNRHEIVGGWPGPWVVLQHVWLGFIGVSGDLQMHHDRYDSIISALLLGLGLMTGLATLYLTLRAFEPRPQLTPDDEARLRRLLQSSPDSLGYFNLRRDKSVVWSDSGKAGVVYRVVNGVMLASGDPIGDPEAWPGAISAFLAMAEAHAWTPAVLGCSERAGLAWCRDTGFSAMELGDEAIIDAAGFSLQGRPMRNVRQMVNRIRRSGYDTQVCRVRELSPDVRLQTLADAAHWRSSETERGFSMALGRTADPVDPDAVLVTASHEGMVRGILQFVPWGTRGMSLDLMRRDTHAEPGINELLISAALEAAPALGVERVSLNFAVFRSVLERGERLGAGPLVRAWRKLIVLASRWFQIESLYRFNAKFRPAWNPRFLIYPGARHLARVAVAALEAEAFLVWPSLRRLGGGGG